LNLRCMFLERDKAAYTKLSQFVDQIEDVDVNTKNKQLEDSIPDILNFVRDAPGTFSFVFIDPTGWTGFGMNVIAPLLQLRPGEVLINFMTDYVRRFIDHPDKQAQKSFQDLFGSTKFKNRIVGLADPQDREDAILQAYAENVKKIGGFSHTCAATALYPQVDRSYFHLIYGTRNRKGVDVFKDVERRAMKVMEESRAEAKQRRRVSKTQQPELFTAQEMAHSRPIDKLRRRNLAEAEPFLLDELKKRGRLSYEQAWDMALSLPLVWESDLKLWINNWEERGMIKIEGLKPGQRVPRLKANNMLVAIK
jgi:three-Cys-motif partner protein